MKSSEKRENIPETIVRRLQPGEDLKQSIQELIESSRLSAGVIVSLVGSLRRAGLRFADAKEARIVDGPFEIVAATGTLGCGKMHIHLCLADGQGRVVGGHIMEGCEINTTAEIVILNLSSNFAFERTLDASTGYAELMPRKNEA
ncbi:MAG TPA: PPC domain-containing DNA-binding protein [Candidatus Obscuribacterales bacterium]